MARKKKTPTPSRPNLVGVCLSDEVLQKLDEWATHEKRKRANAAALLIERALDSQASQTRSA